MGVNRADDPVVGTGHIRANVVTGKGKNNMDSSRVEEPNEGHVIASKLDAVRRYRAEQPLQHPCRSVAVTYSRKAKNNGTVVRTG